jgi:muramoyltetrapeptide carboxypeptidase
MRMAAGLPTGNSLFSVAPMPQTLKPQPLRLEDVIRIISLSSPVERDRVEKGSGELARLGYKTRMDDAGALARDGFFAGAAGDRVAALKEAFGEVDTRAIFCTRGGYGSNYLLDGLSVALSSPKILLGYSDVTSLQIFLWQKFRWVTFYGPMVASGFDKGAGLAEGYDRESFSRAVAEARHGWTTGLNGAESLTPGKADGTLLGGCMTLVETTLGTAWELDTHGAILILEDRGMKPWQIDRALMHLKQAGKFRGVSGVILGDFPECEGPAGTETAKDVAQRILKPLGFPIVWGAAIGHTSRPMLTLPLGVRARLSANESSGATLEILEPACAG